MATIIFNGKTYNSLEEMPPEARQAYEQALSMLADKNQNGTPDALEGQANQPQAGAAWTGGFTPQVVINGQMMSGLDALPPETRAKVEKALGALDANHNGVPDFLENMQSSPFGLPGALISLASAAASAQPAPAAPAAPMAAGSEPPPQIYPPPQLAPRMAPMIANNAVPDEDAGRRRLLIVLVIALVLLILGAMAAALVYAWFFLIPH